MSENEEKFLSRWSRLKRTGGEAGAVPPPAFAQEHQSAAADAPPLELPPIESLTKESDYSVFFQPKVDESLRRAALKKLFTDPHFNVMDGLDTYIDDYSITEPISAQALAGMRSAQKIFQWARGESDEAAAKKEEEAVQPATRERGELPMQSENSVVPAAATTETQSDVVATNNDTESTTPSLRRKPE